MAVRTGNSLRTGKGQIEYSCPGVLGQGTAGGKVKDRYRTSALSLVTGNRLRAGKGQIKESFPGVWGQVTAVGQVKDRYRTAAVGCVDR